MNEDRVHNGWLKICISTKVFAHNRDQHTSQEIPDDNVHADLEYGESSVDFLSFENEHEPHLEGQRRLREKSVPLSCIVPGSVR